MSDTESTKKIPKKKTCAVAICPNPRTIDGFMYHRFPKDDSTRKLWVVKCKRQDKFNPSTSRVFSNHFLPNDYKRDLFNELLGLRQKKILKEDAVPSQNLCLEENAKKQSCLMAEDPVPEASTLSNNKRKMDDLKVKYFKIFCGTM